jgi:hypothetical protein
MSKNKGFRAGTGAAKAGAVATTKTVSFVLGRDTKPGEAGGAAVYSEVDGKGNVIDIKQGGLDAAVVGTLYVRKKSLGGKPPAKLTLTLAFG